MQKLPIGIQHFNVLREEGYLYVDKTEQIHRLINTGKFLFLSRPRRFGKSLLITTLQQLFSGRRELFQGLWIEDKIDWQPRPVIVINFNDLNFLSQSLEQALDELMDKLAFEYRLTFQATNFKGKFQELIERLGVEQKVVILIDEYDKAITDMLGDKERVVEHVKVLKNFYSVLKSTVSERIHFALLTGVSRYGRVSIFSDLNNLIDLSLDRRFATLLGYTQQELESYFSDWIDQVAELYGQSREETIQQIRFWYNGYSWDGVNTLYAPFSTLLFFDQQSFVNHWFSTATPSFLLQLLRTKQIPAYALENLRATSTLLDNADIDQISAFSMLFQTGYLTVKKSYHSALGQRYDLGYPNHEVATAFQQYLLADYLGRDVNDLELRLTDALNEALRNHDIEQFIVIINSVFASIPHTLFLPQEAYFHSVIYLVFKLLGFKILAEPLSHHGRLDALLATDDTIYIIEFKTSSATIALEQIRARGYDQPYRAGGKRIVLLGIAFDVEARRVGEWITEG